MEEVKFYMEESVLSIDEKGTVIDAAVMMLTRRWDYCSPLAAINSSV